MADIVSQDPRLEAPPPAVPPHVVEDAEELHGGAVQGHPKLVGWQDAALHQAGLVAVFGYGGRELPHRGQIRERPAVGDGAVWCLFREVHQIRGVRLGMGAPLRTPLIKSTITVYRASSNCPNSRYSSRSWYGIVAAARWMMARRLAMVARGGGPSGEPVHPVIAWTRVRESASRGARCRWCSWSSATAACWWSCTGTPTTYTGSAGGT